MYIFGPHALIKEVICGPYIRLILILLLKLLKLYKNPIQIYKKIQHWHIYPNPNLVATKIGTKSKITRKGNQTIFKIKITKG